MENATATRGALLYRTPYRLTGGARDRADTLTLRYHRSFSLHARVTVVTHTHASRVCAIGRKHVNRNLLWTTLFFNEHLHAIYYSCRWTDTRRDDASDTVTG